MRDGHVVGASGQKVVRPTLAAALLPLLLCASPAAADIRGRVFEDVNYGGGAGRSFGAAPGINQAGVRVEFYDNTGAFVEFQLTDNNGFSFAQTAGTFTVRVVNSTVTSSRVGYVPGLLPVQTFRTASGGNSPVTDHVGGEVPSLVDAGPNTTGLTLAQLTTATTTAQSITTVTFGGGPNVVNVNFGFNFNTIVNVNDSDQGSLRQFLLNSNALGNATLAIVGQPAGRDVSVFMISDGQAHPGLRAGIANLLSGGVVAVITPVTDLPAVTAADTSVDGTTQTTNVGNTNAAVLGTGGTVGVDGLALNTVAGPEVEIAGSNSGTHNCGLLIQAASAVVRGLAIRGFGDVIGEGGVCVNGAPNALVEGNVLGSGATSFVDPGATALRNEAGVFGGNSSASTVQNNLIGFSRVTGVYLAAGATGWTVTGNEIRDSGLDSADGDGLTINAGTTNTSVGNLITGSSTQGIVVTAGATGNVFTNNTVTGNGVGIPSGLVQTSAIVLRSGVASTVLDRNVIHANYGAGVQVNDGSVGTRMTRNSFALNGTITARNGAAPTGQIGIDLNSPTDDIHFGTAPFYTLNDAGDVDTGGNGLVNFPLLQSATLFGGNLSLQGFARPGSLIEVFIATPDPTGFGEGTTYSITLTEGGTGAGGNDPYADGDSGTGTYGPGPVNGIAQGTDTTNRFVFFFPVPLGIGTGTQLTATATLGGETSEFGGNVTVAAATAVKLMSFTAVPGDGSVTLEWRTGSELDNLGFHVYRGSSANGPWQRLNASLIPGLGSSPEGKRYSLLDKGLRNGSSYYYRLEDVDRSGKVTSHGPVTAKPVARAGAPRLEPADAPNASSPGDSGDGGGTSPEEAGESLSGWTAYGDPGDVSLRVLRRNARSVTLELRTGGFYALREASGTVRVFVPGFDFPHDDKAAALPIRRALTDAVVGRKVQLGAVRALDLVGFEGLSPSALGKPEMRVRRDGTVRAIRRGSAALVKDFPKSELATLLPSVFQGNTKSAVVEIAPFRFDAEGRQLVLARRVLVQLLFTGREVGESGQGSVGRAPGPRKPAGSGATLARLYTTSRGLYSVSFEQLFPGQKRGFAASQLRLERQGETAAFHFAPSSDAFAPGSRLYFYADRTAASTDFTAEVAWELVLARDGVAMPIVSAAPAGASIFSGSTGLASFETNRFYQPGLLEAKDLWLWEVLASGAARVKTFSLAGVDTASLHTAVLDVDLQGASESGGAVDHHLSVSLNGAPVGDAQFAGKQSYRMSLGVPASLLREGANELSLTNVADTGVSSVVFLDRFSIAHAQVSSMSAGVFEGSFREAGTATVSGATSAVVVLDVTAAPRWLSGFTAAGGMLRFRAEAGHRYLAVSQPLAPRVATPAPSTLRARSNQADYLLIAPQAFLAAAEPLVARRADQGLTTRAVSFEEIAAEFGHGQAGAEAIKGFLGYVFHSWARPSPRYVLLLGDASYDPRNFMGTSLPAPLPATWTKTSYLWTVSDPQLAAVNGDDGVPDLAIGRLPATTLAQAEALVAKLIAWEDSGQGLAGPAALVADDPDAGGDFTADVEDIAQSYLAGRDPQAAAPERARRRRDAAPHPGGTRRRPQPAELRRPRRCRGLGERERVELLGRGEPAGAVAPAAAFDDELPQRLLRGAELRVAVGIPAQGRGPRGDRQLLAFRPEPRWPGARVPPRTRRGAHERSPRKDRRRRSRARRRPTPPRA